MTGPYSDELACALEAARLASAFILAEYANFEVIPDAPASISTAVDKGAQERILGHIRAKYPADGILAEESTPGSGDSPKSERVWVVDPIDGTRGFARKTGEFSVMIALAVSGEPVMGVVLEPVLDRVTYAVKGAGCWSMTGDSLAEQESVSQRTDLSDATLAGSHGPAKAVVAAVKPGRVVETYSAGIKLAMVARGEADLYLNDHDGFHDWDICAGHILVTEAGGAVSLFDGTPITYGGSQVRRGGMAATNGLLHGEVVKRLAGVGG